MEGPAGPPAPGEGRRWREGGRGGKEGLETDGWNENGGAGARHGCPQGHACRQDTTQLLPDLWAPARRSSPGRPGEPGDTAVTRPPAAGPRRAGRCCRSNNRKLQEGKTRLMPSAGCFPPPSRPVPRIPAATAACPCAWDRAHAPPAPAPRQAALVFFIVEVQL